MNYDMSENNLFENFVLKTLHDYNFYENNELMINKEIIMKLDSNIEGLIIRMWNEVNYLEPRILNEYEFAKVFVIWYNSKKQVLSD